MPLISHSTRHHNHVVHPPHIPRSPGKEYLLLALSCMGEWELEVEDDIVLLLGDLTVCMYVHVRREGTSCDTGNRIQEAGWKTRR